MDKIKFGIEIGAALSSSYSNTIGSVNKDAVQIGSTLKSLSKIKLDVKEFKRLKQDANANKTELVKMSKALEDAGLDINDLDGSVKKLSTSMALLKKQSKIRLEADGLRSRLDEQKSSLLTTAAVGYSLKSLVSSYGEVADAQGEIKSLGIDDSGIKKITLAAKEFSNQWAGTTTSQFISASYDIKSGISTLSDGAVGEFTKIAALTGVATKSNTAQMTNLFATGYGIYRDQFESFGASTIAGWNNLSQEEKDIKFGEYFSSGISNTVQAFKTNGGEMSAALSNLGASATSAGVSFQEQLSILGQLQTTMSGSEAATKYRAFLSSAQGAGEKLDLQFTDANNQLLPMLDIIDNLKNKYGDTLDAVEKAELKKAFGTDEAVQMIDLLYNKTDQVGSNMNSLKTSLQGGMDKTVQMAKDINAGPNKSFAILGQQIGNLAATIGKTLAPAATLIASGLGKIVKGVDWLSETFPGLTSFVFGLGGSLLGLVVVYRTVAIASTFLKLQTLLLKGSYLGFLAKFPQILIGMKSIGSTLSVNSIKTAALSAKTWALNVANKALSAGSLVLGTSLKVLGAAVGFVGKTFVWLGRALMANPIGLIIGVIAGGAYLIYSYWEPIKGFFGGLWDSVKSIFNGAWDGIKKGLSFTPLGLILSNWEPIKQYFLDLWDGLVGGFLKTFEKIGNVWSDVKSFFGFGGDEEKKDISLGSTKKEEYFKDTKLKEVYKPADIKPVNNRSFTTVENKKTVESSTPGTAYKESVAKKPKEPSKVKQTAAAVMIGSSLVSVPATPGEAATVQPKAKTEMVSQSKTVSSPASYTVQVTFTGDIVVQSKDGKVVESGQLKDNIEEQVRVALARLKDEKKNRSFEDEVI
jgi:TP901 family phage tail tape measure protein